MQGKVKWFNNSQGFGFVTVDGINADIFVHHTQIKMDGYRTLKTNQEIEFELIEAPTGKQAHNVTPIKKD
jgi:CspA family cold shock protein